MLYLLLHANEHKFNLNISKLGFKPNNISPKVIKLTKNVMYHNICMSTLVDVVIKSHHMQREIVQ